MPVEITDCSVNDGEVMPGDTASGEAVVENTDQDREAEYEVALSINGEIEDSEVNTIAPGGTETFGWEFTRSEPGDYSIGVAIEWYEYEGNINEGLVASYDGDDVDLSDEGQVEVWIDSFGGNDAVQA